MDQINSKFQSAMLVSLVYCIFEMVFVIVNRKLISRDNQRVQDRAEKFIN